MLTDIACACPISNPSLTPGFFPLVPLFCFFSFSGSFCDNLSMYPPWNREENGPAQGKRGSEGQEGVTFELTPFLWVHDPNNWGGRGDRESSFSGPEFFLLAWCLLCFAITQIWRGRGREPRALDVGALPLALGHTPLREGVERSAANPPGTRLNLEKRLIRARLHYFQLAQQPTRCATGRSMERAPVCQDTNVERRQIQKPPKLWRGD